MKNCRFCLSEIHEEALKCHKCRAWQSRSGLVSALEEKVLSTALAVALLVVVTLVAISFGNSYVRDMFKENPDAVMWHVLRDYPESSSGNNTTYSIDGINIFNYFQAQGKVDRMIEQALHDNANAIVRCIHSFGSSCKDVNVIESSEERLVIGRPKEMHDLSADYIQSVTRRTMLEHVSIFHYSSDWVLEWSDSTTF